MTRVRIDYGKEGLEVEIPTENLRAILELNPVPLLEDPAGQLDALLANPLGTRSLAELAAGKKSACVLICDITRPVPNRLILGRLLPVLQRAGVRRDATTILIATGLHRPSSKQEIEEMVGSEIASTYSVENHYGTRRDEHDFLGRTPTGVPVWIDRRYLAADLKIAIGLIEPHLMAGFSGGRKLICPGIAALETVRAWHGPDFLEHPKADCGVLDGNPVHQENTRIARMAGCDFIVNVTLDQHRNVTAIVAGDMEQAFLAGVEHARRAARTTIDQLCDIVVTSGAGYPLDATFYQSIKGLTGVLPIVKQGGTIVLAARMDEGIGSAEFQRLCEENESLDAFMHRILGKGYFVLDQWQLEELAKVRRKAHVTVVNDTFSPTTMRRFFVDAAETVESAVADAIARHGSRATIAVVPQGPYVLPRVES